jgi:membrane protein DedA with SNARE-associated domain
MHVAWALYLGLLLGPFLQEDAAVLGAAGASAARLGPWWALFATAFVGLVCSDAWKFWIGRAMRRHKNAAAWAEKRHIAALRDKIAGRLGVTLMFARFIPGTRIPAYIAAGFFGAPFAPFVGYLMISAAAYLGLAFAIVAIAGEAAGEDAAHVVPFVAIGLLLCILGVSWLRSRMKPSQA